jgi:quinoprotein relay system zinc metallohydrolase 2
MQRPLSRIAAWPLLGVCLLGLMLCAVAAPDPATPLPVDQVAPGVWVHVGAIADFAPDNGGDLANLGFVIGERCVAVIDTGGSFRVGAGLLAAVRARTTLPVCFVIATHMHPDHLLGHAAFAAEHPAYVAAARQSKALAVRAAGFLRRQGEALGALAAGTTVVLPDHPVEDRETLDLGGRSLELRAWRTAHTDNDLTVQDRLSGTLFTGDLLFRSHLPVIDGSARGWLTSIDELARIRADAVVPGHGPVTHDGAAAFAQEHVYLSSVVGEVRAALKAHRTLSQAVAESAPPQGWQLTELYHRRNVTAAYAELEWED